MIERGSHELRSQRRALLPVERLERRALLSTMPRSSHPHATTVTRTVDIGAPGTFVSQQATALDVTLTLNTTSITKGSFGTITESLPNTEPLTLYFSATLGSSQFGGQEVQLPASASATFTPIHESITFPPGVTTEKVTIPIHSVGAEPAEVPIGLSVTSPSLSKSFRGQQSTVYLVDGQQGLPPTITSARLVVTGHNASGIALTFSKPMAPATVGNIHNYSIWTPHEPAGLPDALSFPVGVASELVPVGAPPAGVPTVDRRTIALKAAQYDASTDTVVVVPARPLELSKRAFVTIRQGHAGQGITDLQGYSLFSDSMDTFGMTIAVHRRAALLQPLTISEGS
jgi:hypothetical protein